MSGVALVPGKSQVSDANGAPLAGGTVDVYLAGTTTRTNSYQDQALTVLNTNPIVLDSSGSCSMWLDGSTLYKIVVKNAAGATQSHLGGDNLSGAAASGALISFLQSGTGAVSRSAQTKMREIVSVKDFGAVGDGVTDDTAAIQKAINFVCSSSFAGGVLNLGPGKFRITSTLAFPALSGGGVFAGSGICASSPFSPSLGSNTILLWDGAVGGTMISQDAALGWTFRDFTFCGKLTSGGTSLAGIGYLLTGNANPGSGVSRFDSVGFQYITTSCQFGSVLDGAGNNADIVFEQCSWINCDTGIIINVQQGLNYNINSGSVVGLRRFVYAPRGGAIHVKMTNFSDCGDSADATAWVFQGGTSNNGGNLIIENCRIETGGGGTSYCQQFLYITGGRATLIGVTETQEGQSNVLMFKLEGGQLTMRDCRLSTLGATTPAFSISSGGGNLFAKVTIEDTDFLTPSGWVPTSWFNIVNANLPSVLSVSRSRAYINSGDFRAIPFIGSSISHGPVTQETLANGNTNRNLTLLGTTALGPATLAYIPPDSCWLIVFDIVGSTPDGATVFSGQRRAMVKYVAGTLSQVGVTEVIGTDINPGGWGLPTINVANALKTVNVFAPNIVGDTKWRARMVGTPVTL